MRLFGIQLTNEDAASVMETGKLTRGGDVRFSRFGEAQVHVRRQPTTKKRPVQNTPNPVVTAVADAPAQSAQIHNLNPAHASDQLYSESGITPSILRRALPQRFGVLDAKREADAEDLDFGYTLAANG